MPDECTQLLRRNRRDHKFPDKIILWLKISFAVKILDVKNSTSESTKRIV